MMNYEIRNQKSDGRYLTCGSWRDRNTCVKEKVALRHGGWMLEIPRLPLLAGLMLLAVYTGCERDVADPDWPKHDGKLVIVASIEATEDSLTLLCRVTKTLPLDVQFSEAASLVTNASVTVLYDGIEHAAASVPLEHDVMPYQNYQATFPRSAARDVQLRVRHEGKTAVSSQHLSDAPGIDSVQLQGSSFGGDTQVVAWIHSADILSAYYLRIAPAQFQPYYPNDSFFGQYLSRGAGTLGCRTMISHTTGSVLCHVVMRSSEHDDCVRAMYSGDGGGDPFDNSSGKNPPFNVSGDGIGFFWSVVHGPAREISWR